MLDIETLGLKDDALIFQIAAASFDIRTGEIKDTINIVADISKQEKINVEPDTLKFWAVHNSELFKELLNRGSLFSPPPKGALKEFAKWLKSYDKESTYLWGNGIMFDNRKIAHQLEAMGEEYPITYRNDRDVRTLVELASIKTGIESRKLKDSFKQRDYEIHDAMEDVKYQIDFTVGCFNLLTK